jgi:cytochrome c oxidase subunit 1
VLGITLLLLAMERLFHIGIFDPQLGGDPVLFQHFFWFYSHPAVYIMILPAMAVMSEVIPVFSKKTIFGYKAIAFSSVAIALLGFLVWAHHMFVAGMSIYAGAIFSFLTFFIAIPSAIKVFNWIATMWEGSIELRSPMLYAIAFLLVFTIGGLTGLFLASLSTDVHLHDTYFVVAHFHYVMAGSNLLALLAGLHYWWPKMFGRLYNESLARIGCVLVFLGFNATFIPQFIMGSRGMPRRYYNYLPQFQALHVASTIGAMLLAVGLFLTLANLLASFRRPKGMVDNPWGGKTLEWATSSPPPTENFEGQPVPLHGPYDYRAVPAPIGSEVHTG